MIEDVVVESGRRLAALAPRSVADVRAAAAPVVGWSGAGAAVDGAVKEFLFAHMYRSPRGARIMGDAENRVRDLVAHYAAHPYDMPAEWAQNLDAADEAGRMRRIADFIAGMTDRYALTEHARFFDSTPELR
jgi:dGTPase